MAVNAGQERRFRQHVGACAMFLKDHGRLPAIGDLDHDGYDIGTWLWKCRRASSGAGQLAWNPERQALLDEAVPDWAQGGRAQRSIRQRAREYAAFVETHGRLPKRTASSLSERSLAKWMSELRCRQASGKAIPPQQRVHIDQLVPGWDEQPIGPDLHGDRLFRQRAEQWVTFVATHDRLPGFSNAEEGSLSGWFENVQATAEGRSQHFRWSPERVRILDELIPGWAEVRRRSGSDEERFVERARQMAAFVAQIGRWPNKASDDTEERSLGVWLINTRLAAKGTGGMTWSLERQEILDEVIPGWATSIADRTAADAFARKVRELAEFLAEYGRFPMEGSLGSWLKDCRRVARGKPANAYWSPAREAMLDEHVPGWRVTAGDVKFRKHCLECAEFVAVNGRWPVTDTFDRAERRLAVWLSAARKSRRGHPKSHLSWSSQREDLLDTLLPGWTDRHPRGRPGAPEQPANEAAGLREGTAPTASAQSSS